MTWLIFSFATKLSQSVRVGWKKNQEDHFYKGVLLGKQYPWKKKSLDIVIETVRFTYSIEKDIIVNVGLKVAISSSQMLFAIQDILIGIDVRATFTEKFKSSKGICSALLKSNQLWVFQSKNPKSWSCVRLSFFFVCQCNCGIFSRDVSVKWSFINNINTKTLLLQLSLLSYHCNKSRSFLSP